MKALINNQIPITQWEAFIKTSDYSTAFQTHQFWKFFNAVPGFSAEAFAIEENNELKCLCVVTLQKEKGLKAYFSRRAIIYGGPVIADSQEIYLNQLIKSICKHFQSKVIYIETRNFHDYAAYKNVFQTNGFVYENYLNYQLDCSSEELVFKNLNNNRKRQIKKAFAKGVLLQEANNEQDVTDYYYILNELYRNKIKKPLFPLEFFIQFYKSKVGKILLVKADNKIIGGIICPILENKCIYELYICGLDQDYKDYSPSVMSTFAAIEYGYKNNLKLFDFMGAGKANEDYGVRDFKEKFGGELVKHGRYIKINNKILFNVGKLGLTVIKKIKSS